MPYNLITAPVSEPISLVEAKDHLRVDITGDDALIARQIELVRRAVEDSHDLCLLTQTWDWYMDDFPSSPIVIPKWPLASVTSITYVDDADASTVYASSNYRVDTYSQPGRIVLKSTASWPSVTLKEVNAVAIRFVAGWTAPELVPEQIRQAMLMMLGDLYENREDTIIGTITKRMNIPQILMMNHRSFHF